MNRRQFLQASSAALALPVAGCVARPIPVQSPDASSIPPVHAGTLVNDIHSQLNPTQVASIVQPRNVDALHVALTAARDRALRVAVAGGRHAMGGQQFAEGALLVDTRALDRVLAFDAEQGSITVEGGIQWPALLAYLANEQQARDQGWGIVQKQTGADRLSIAGAVSCNAHGRGLTLQPIVQQVECFDLLTAAGNIVTCSRLENRELFGLAIGGYGLFGIITRVQLGLRRRVKVRRVVALVDTSGISERFEERIRDGYLYGDYQFTTDATRDSFLRRGIFACYEPVSADTPLTASPARFRPEDWARLTFYSHTHKRRAFQVYSSRYLQTSGQIYWSDGQLAASYMDNYHLDLDRAVRAKVHATEMITELYVQRPRLSAFMEDARVSLRRAGADVIYGTVRLIDQDEETFLPWARERYACIIFNLHVEHTPRALDAAAAAFRGLIDIAISHGGSYYLTYHRWARKDQVERCYPQMSAFLAAKRKHDPGELFQSTWYRHMRELFAGDRLG